MSFANRFPDSVERFAQIDTRCQVLQGLLLFSLVAKCRSPSQTIDSFAKDKLRYVEFSSGRPIGMIVRFDTDYDFVAEQSEAQHVALVGEYRCTGSWLLASKVCPIRSLST